MPAISQKNEITKLAIYLPNNGKHNIFEGIGEESTKFEKGKGVLMTFYTNQDRENTNALCQYWDMKDGVGSKWKYY